MYIIDLGAPSHYRTLGISPNATALEIGTARSQKQTFIKQKLRTVTDEKEKKVLEDQLLAVNAAGDKIARPEKRKEYDRENAHLQFYLERTIAVPFFVSKIDRLFVLHHFIKEYLAGEGFNLPPLCDLDREDFTADETPLELLDKLLA